MFPPLFLWGRVRVGVLLIVGDEDRLVFAVVFQRHHALFASDTALLHAAERRFDMHTAAAVDREHSGFNGARHT